MSLGSIANFIVSEAGVPYETDSQKAYLHDRINKSAEELYINNELPNCLKEVYVEFNGKVSETFTLPNYVYKVRGLRRPHYDFRNGMTFTNMLPRYQKQTWGDVALDNVRIVGQTAIARDVCEEQNITVVLNSTLAEDVKIVIIGDTAQESGRIVKVTIPAGQTNATFSSPFLQITSITKSPFFYGIVNGYEELAPGAPLFQIPSAFSTPLYTKVQVQDMRMFIVTQYQYVTELLFKPRLPVMYDIDSEFIVPVTYDQPIAWWTIANYIKTGDQASMYAGKAAGKLANINEDEERGQKQTFNVGYNVHAETYDRLTFNAW